MPTTKQLQHGNTLYCVTQQNLVLPAVISFMNDEPKEPHTRRTLKTTLAPEMESDAGAVSYHGRHFATLHSFDGVLDESNIFDDRQAAYDYALLRARETAASLAAKMLVNDKVLERLAKESKV